MKRSYARGTIEASLGSTHSSMTIAESVAYIDLQYDDYRTYAGLGKEKVTVKKILEFGCGDNVGVALRYLADGATQVVCIDKFYSLRDPDHERRVYLEMRRRLSSEQRRAFDEVISLDRGIEINQSRLRCIYGMELDQFANIAASEGELFDIVLSRAVIEEIYEPEPIFMAADRLLKNGGLMSHKIDLSDYGLFSSGGMHQLTFLTIPEWIYRKMASESGVPNRKPIGYYRSLMDRLGYDAKFFISSIIGVGDVVPHKENIQLNVDYGRDELLLVESMRRKLNPLFASLPAEDLLVSSIFLVAQKPLPRGELNSEA